MSMGLSIGATPFFIVFGIEAVLLIGIRISPMRFSLKCKCLKLNGYQSDEPVDINKERL